MKIKLFLLLFFLSISSFAINVPHFFRNGGTDNNWGTLGNWATDTNNANPLLWTNAIALPTSSDDVYFPAKAGVITCTVNVAASCLNLDFLSFAGTFAGTASLKIYGYWKWNNLFTNSYTGTIQMYAASGTPTIFTGGKVVLGGIGFGPVLSTATWKLLDNLIQDSTNGTSVLTYGYIDVAGHQFATATFTSTTNVARGVTSSVAGGVINIITKNSVTPLNITNGSTFSVTNPQNLTMKVSSWRTSNGGMTCKFGGKTFGNVEFARPQSNDADTLKYWVIFESNNFSELKTSRKLVFTDGTTTGITGLNIQSSASIKISLRGSSTAGWTISYPLGNLCVDYIRLSYSTATGGGHFYAGSNSVNTVGNTGWSFSSCPPIIRFSDDGIYDYN